MNALQVSIWPFALEIPDFQKTQKVYAKAYDLLSNIFDAYDITKDGLRLPSYAHTIAKAISYIGIVDIVFAGPRLISSITDLTQSKTSERFNSAISTVSECCNLFYLACQITQVAREVGVFAKNSYLWIDFLGYAFLPSQLISLYQSIEHSYCVWNISKMTRESPIAILHYVHDNADDIQYRLSLSRKCYLKQHSELYLQKIHDANTQKTSQAFLQALGTRMNTTCALAIIDTIRNAVYTLLSCAMIVQTATTPLMNGIYTAIVITGISLTIINNILISKRPTALNPNIVRLT